MTERRDNPLVFVKVKVAKKAARIDLSERLRSFEYIDSEKKADTLRLSVDNWDLKNFDEPIWAKGNTIEVTWGYPGNFAPVRSLRIKKVTGFSILSVEAHGGEALLNRRVNCFAWEGLSFFEIVQTLAERHGYGTDRQFIEDTDETRERREVVSQARRTDAQFLRRLATKLGFEFFLDFDGFHFHKRDMGQNPTRFIQYYTSDRGDVRSFNVEEEHVRRYGTVRVSAREPLTKKALDFVADLTDLDDKGTTSKITDVLSAYAGQTDGTLKERLEAQEGARAIGEVLTAFGDQTTRDELAKDLQDGAIVAGKVIDFAGLLVGTPVLQNVRPFVALASLDVKTDGKKRVRRALENGVKATLGVVGDPSYLAKTVIVLGGVGKRLSGKYYIKEARHSIGSGGYSVDLKVISDGHSGYVRTGFQDLIGDPPKEKTPGKTGDEMPDCSISDQSSKLIGIRQLGVVGSFSGVKIHKDDKCRRPPPNTLKEAQSQTLGAAAQKGLLAATQKWFE